MASLDLPSPLSEPRTPTTVQPGGGLCVDLEAVWGRTRRRWLRAARPGYVSKMAAKRRGSCEGCTHDVIDARDLKLVRNVCGWSFAEEDDPFRWRDRIGLARAGLAEVVCSSIACATLLSAFALAGVLAGSLLFAVPLVAIGVFWFQMVWFFRDPHREIPDDPDALLSPSDGVITHLEQIDAADFPGGRAFRISIYLSPYDVHLNRNPRNARVVSTRYFPGRFLNARHKDCVKVNEQLWTDFVESNGRPFRVKQVSGKMARRLVCSLKPGEEVKAGAKSGMIKFGSRCDVLLPAAETRQMMVKIGDRVCAGSTILLRFSREV